MSFLPPGIWHVLSLNAATWLRAHRLPNPSYILDDAGTAHDACCCNQELSP